MMDYGALCPGSPNGLRHESAGSAPPNPQREGSTLPDPESVGTTPSDHQKKGTATANPKIEGSASPDLEEGDPWGPTPLADRHRRGRLGYGQAYDMRTEEGTPLHNLRRDRS